MFRNEMAKLKQNKDTFSSSFPHYTLFLIILIKYRTIFKDYLINTKYKTKHGYKLLILLEHTKLFFRRHISLLPKY